MNHSPKSLMRMFGTEGNPQDSNLFQIVADLQKNEGVRLEVRAMRREGGRKREASPLILHSTPEEL